VQDDATEDLHVEVAKPELAMGYLANQRERLDHQGVGGRTGYSALAERTSPLLQLRIRLVAQSGVELTHAAQNSFCPRELPLGVASDVLVDPSPRRHGAPPDSAGVSCRVVPEGADERLRARFCREADVVEHMLRPSIIEVYDPRRSRQRPPGAGVPSRPERATGAR
jgi:hypothetical protein